MNVILTNYSHVKSYLTPKYHTSNMLLFTGTHLSEITLQLFFTYITFTHLFNYTAEVWDTVQPN